MILAGERLALCVVGKLLAKATIVHEPEKNIYIVRRIGSGGLRDYGRGGVRGLFYVYSYRHHCANE
jgi:hypothetical protein